MFNNWSYFQNENYYYSCCFLHGRIIFARKKALVNVATRWWPKTLQVFVITESLMLASEMMAYCPTSSYGKSELDLNSARTQYRSGLQKLFYLGFFNQKKKQKGQKFCFFVF